MSLRRLQVTDFRCLQAATLDLDPNYTLIFGPNASGKTALLEAIYVLGRGRSFRTRQIEHLIRRGSERFVVFGEVDAGSRVPLGVEGTTQGIRARISGEKPASLAELALRLPVQIIDPEVHRLIEEGPSRRRRFLDWGVFHVEPDFVSLWQRYGQVLRQRNAALKSSDRQLVGAWNAELLRYGAQLTEARQRYMEQMVVPAKALTKDLLNMELSLSYRPGWPKDLTLSAALEQSWNKDLERGATQVGPHRAELGIRLDGLPVKDRVSRGQQKLLAAALLMAQVKLFPADSPIQPTLLLDDPAAELDGHHLALLIQAVRAQPVQLIVTTLQPEFSAFGAPARRYEIKGGSTVTC